MDNVLDNPVWNAMISGNSNLASGTDRVKLFPEDVSPFAGLSQPGTECLEELFNLLSYKRTVAVVTTLNLNIPPYFKIIRQQKVLQMVATNAKTSPNYNGDFVPLYQWHIAQMIALTQLTNPGPFLERTIEFGNYAGIFQQDRLVAMAGHRLHINKYVEISGVCTHPDHTGKGYGSSLVMYQARSIIANTQVPFLHVMADNAGAIVMYQRLGFVIRTELNLYVIQKSN